MLLTILLTSCQGTTPLTPDKPTAPEIVNAGASFCQIAKPLCYARSDTSETIIQIRIHNEKGKALGCNWTPDMCVKVQSVPTS